MPTPFARSFPRTAAPPAFALALALSFQLIQAGIVYPGTSPGPAAVHTSNSQVILTNQAIAAWWLLPGDGIAPAAIHDVQAGRTLARTGEAFRIELEDGRRLPASRLKRQGEPVVTRLEADPRSSRLAGRIEGQQVELALLSDDGHLRVHWRALLTDGANYLREELAISAVDDDVELREIVWLDQALPSAAVAGTVDGSPLTADNIFFGAEDPMAANRITNGTVQCRLPRPVRLSRGETLTQSFVWGVTPPGQQRRAFLHYLERERAHPFRPFLHYNSWYDIAWDPFALNETNCLDAIRTFGERFIRPHGAVVDAMVFDDGWDDPKTLWQFHGGFPNGFTPLADLCRQYETRLGVWLSPFGGYGAPKEQRLEFGRQQGYELNATGFSLAGPKYYAAFKRSCVEMIRRYGVNHFKFDGIAAGMYADGGAEHAADTEAMRRLMLELRQEAPDLYINLTTGSWPSPFWLRYADSLWRQGNDMGHAGQGTRQQQWLTYRDQEVRRNIVGKGPLFPLNSLMTQGVAWSRHGLAGDATFTSAGFRDDVRAFFGSGTGLQELYLQPGRLTAEDWAVLAEAAKWARAHADVLVDTHWIGGDPAAAEIYGYASWSPRKGIVMLRNPDVQPREFALEVGTAFELPPGAPRRYSLRSAWAEDRAKPSVAVEAGKPLSMTLQPFEIVVLEAEPQTPAAP